MKVVAFEAALPEYAVELALDQGRSVYPYRPELLAALPNALELLDELKRQAEEACGAQLEYVSREDSSWLYAMRGPCRGAEKHSEGSSAADHTLLVALTTVPEGHGGDLHVEGAGVFPHRVGRAVIFPSGTLHWSDRLTVDVLRVGLATLVREA